jgi:hypothetical protein
MDMLIYGNQQLSLIKPKGGKKTSNPLIQLVYILLNFLMHCNKFGECAVGYGFIRMALYDFFLSKYCHENQKK